MKPNSGILLFILAVLLVACKGTAPTQPTVEVMGQRVSVDSGFYTDISVAELQTMLASKDFTFINVHTPFEGNISKTDLSIAYDVIGQNLDKLPSDKNAKILLYCRSGRMSAIAAKTLVGQGYTNIWNLSSGMTAWEQAGLKIDR
jgi:rhodanese-related sulfurtransferase